MRFTSRAFTMFSVNDASCFEVTTSFEGPNAVLTLHGRVESLDAFDLGAALDAAIDLHCPSVRLDISELEFVGAAGLVAVANAERRFAEAGVELTVQTPSRLVRLLLDEAELVKTAIGNQPVSKPGHLGSEEIVGSDFASRRTVSEGSSEDLRRVTAIPADAHVVDGALSLVVELARRSVRGADGVSVSLLRHGVLSTVAASDRTITEMDADQYMTGEGPCVDASLQGHWFHAESLESETRWPSFTPQARALGIMAILSSPLKALGQPVGALNIYSRTASTFDVTAQEEAAIFAGKASEILSDAHAGVTDTQLGYRFQEALRSREIIAMAKGILMRHDVVDEGEAFTELLHYSLENRLSLLDAAKRFVLSAARPDFGF
jgi:anti-anti-sigma regulatory factor